MQWLSENKGADTCELSPALLIYRACYPLGPGILYAIVHQRLHIICSEFGEVQE
ncbi:hypothetical protein GCM10025859_51750 [Alicyclobacillus fastidiosus]|nr:hypothetical protein GCM10025859_51750 [Alicyclobacillus fastidiosus]